MIVAGIGVDQDDFVTFGSQGLAGLSARIIELAGLTDDDRPGADDHDALQIGSLAASLAHFASIILSEIVEQIVRVVRAGRGFGVILHAENRLAAMAETFDVCRSD